MIYYSPITDYCKNGKDSSGAFGLVVNTSSLTPDSLAVESKKRVQRRINWYSNDIGIKICEMFHTITYTKST